MGYLRVLLEQQLGLHRSQLPSASRTFLHRPQLVQVMRAPWGSATCPAQLGLQCPKPADGEHAARELLLGHHEPLQRDQRSAQAPPNCHLRRPVQRRGEPGEEPPAEGREPPSTAHIAEPIRSRALDRRLTPWLVNSPSFSLGGEFCPPMAHVSTGGFDKR